MEKVVHSLVEAQDCVIMTAAVSDYRVKNYSEQKIKKTPEDEITLTLVKNPDILKSLSTSKSIIVGFCAESENLIENAKKKIVSKGCDFLVANDISRHDIGFSSDMNEVYILDKNLNITHIEKDTKNNIAQKILEKVFE
jgi:phosphopantothenoylcysteine decarboxylase/phosphopantothenate--cysteine ligase